MINFALSISFLLARASAEIIGPHLLDGTDTPTLHRDIAQNQVSFEDLLAPFAGKKTGLAFRVHADNDAKTTDGGVADAIVASLRETGLPADPAEAVAVLTKSPGTQRRPQLWRRGLYDQVERWYGVERRAL